MSFSRVVIVFFALSPFTFGASKEIMELQRDVALLQDQVRTLQSSLDQKVAAIQTLTQQTLDSVNRTNTAVAVMENRFNDTMKQQQQSLTGPVANVGQKLDQMSEDFRAVRESVLDMNTRMGKLDAKIADLENLINTVRAPAASSARHRNPSACRWQFQPRARFRPWRRNCRTSARSSSRHALHQRVQRLVGRQIRHRLSGVQRLFEVFRQHGPCAHRAVLHRRHLLIGKRTTTTHSRLSTLCSRSSQTAPRPLTRTI